MENLSRQMVEKMVRQAVTGSSDLICDSWICHDVDTAVKRAAKAQRFLQEMGLAGRKKVISHMREAALRCAEELAKLANEETGYGQYAHKVQKHILSATNTPGVECLETFATSGDNGLTLIEYAPFGVIGAITPSTNPGATIINNSISMVAAGNGVVFNPHPAAIKTCLLALEKLNGAVVSAGGPDGLLCCIEKPTIESGQQLMTHPGVRLLAITGGEAVVNLAMKSGKRCVCAGPGNPPVIVDETADILKAASDIISGAGFDNNILCIAEKEIIAVNSIADQLLNSMERNGAARISGQDIDSVTKRVLTEKNGTYAINRNYVGKGADVILSDAGISFSGKPQIIIADLPENHPLVTTEMMMPIIGLVRTPNIETAIPLAVKLENGCHHTAVMHSTNVNNLTKAAIALDTTIFVKNAPSYAGVGFTGEGFTSFTIATPTGEGVTSARSFSRIRRCVLGGGSFRII